MGAVQLRRAHNSRRPSSSWLTKTVGPTDYSSRRLCRPVFACLLLPTRRSTKTGHLRACSRHRLHCSWRLVFAHLRQPAEGGVPNNYSYQRATIRKSFPDVSPVVSEKKYCRIGYFLFLPNFNQIKFMWNVFQLLVKYHPFCIVVQQKYFFTTNRVNPGLWLSFPLFIYMTYNKT